MKTGTSPIIISGNQSLRKVQAFSSRIAYYTNRAGRPENQDGLLIVKNKDRTVLAVADGIAGSPGGMEAAQIALQTLKSEIKRGSALVPCFLQANVEVLKEAYSNSDLEGMGTTLSAAEIAGDEVEIVYCGDSRVFQITKERKVGLLTLDQVPATDNYLENNQSLSLPYFDVAKYWDYMERARSREDLIILTNFIGAPFMTVSSSKFHIKKGNRLLLCTDGLTNYISFYELFIALSNMNALEKTITDLQIKATIFMYNLIKTYDVQGDNLTMILYEHGG